MAQAAGRLPIVRSDKTFFPSAKWTCCHFRSGGYHCAKRFSSASHGLRLQFASARFLRCSGTWGAAASGFSKSSRYDPDGVRALGRTSRRFGRVSPISGLPPTTDLETGVAVGRRGRLGHRRPFKYEIVLTTEVSPGPGRRNRRGECLVRGDGARQGDRWGCPRCRRRL